MFKYLEQNGIKDNIDFIIERCVTNKANIVSIDEFDKGMRQLLNLGHTIGHAIEICSSLSITHGQAVAIGTIIATKISISLGLCSQKDLAPIVELFEKAGLPTKTSYTAKELSSVFTSWISSGSLLALNISP